MKIPHVPMPEPQLAHNMACSAKPEDQHGQQDDETPTLSLSVCLWSGLVWSGLSVGRSVCLSVCWSVGPSVGRSVCLSVQRATHLRASVCLSIGLSICLSVQWLETENDYGSAPLCLSVCLSVRRSVCLPKGLRQ